MQLMADPDNYGLIRPWPRLYGESRTVIDRPIFYHLKERMPEVTLQTLWMLLMIFILYVKLGVSPPWQCSSSFSVIS